MARLSNTLLGVVNILTLLLSIAVLGSGIWLAVHAGNTTCERYLSSPVIAIGVFLLLASIAGLAGACCRVNWLLWIYLLAMFILIVVLFGFTVFAFVVTNKGAGEAVSGRGFKEYRLDDYSNWLRKRVDDSGNWAKIRSCLSDGQVCKALSEKKQTSAEFFADNLSPIESGCCKPPTDCGFTYQSPTSWSGAPSSNNTDCTSWSNDASTLCYSCNSCKAGVVATLKNDWKTVAIVNIVVLVFLVIVYSVGCCAFRNNRRDGHSAAGWKRGGYA